MGWLVDGGSSFCPGSLFAYAVQADVCLACATYCGSLPFCSVTLPCLCSKRQLTCLSCSVLDVAGPCVRYAYNILC